MILRIILVSSLYIQKVFPGCPFQNPFFFVDTPSVVTVKGSDGKMVADRVRVNWGQVENFKCVDYFQIEYYQEEDPVGTAKLSGKINKNRKSHDIDIQPCSNYLFKVIASEDWKGMREDFRMASDTISFRVDFTPKFKRPPVVKERRLRTPRTSQSDRRRSAPRGRQRREPLFEDVGKTPAPPTDPPTPPPAYNVWVSWQLSSIDWPMCLDYFEFDYINTIRNESVLKRTFKAPFEEKMEFDLLSDKVPCGNSVAFIARVYGVTGDHSTESWSPPSCGKQTTQVQVTTTSTTTEMTTTREEGAYEKAVEKNKKLKEEMSGLKQQYGPIGETMYEAIKDSIYRGFEAYLARKKVMDGGDIGQITELAKNSDDPFYAMNNMI